MFVIKFVVVFVYTYNVGGKRPRHSIAA